MKTLKIALLASVAAVGFGSAAQAADLVVLDPVVQEFATGFDWDGAYINVSVYGGVTDFSPNIYGVAGTIGFGGTSDSFYYGAEVAAVYDGLFQDFALRGDVRLGVLVTDDVLLYGLAGLGYAVGNQTAYGILGAGVEFAVSDSMTIRAQYEAEMYDFGGIAHVGAIGLSWYF